jgi:hypothetical protein
MLKFRGVGKIYFMPALRHSIAPEFSAPNALRYYLPDAFKI